MILRETRSGTTWKANSLFKRTFITADAKADLKTSMTVNTTSSQTSLSAKLHLVPICLVQYAELYKDPCTYIVLNTESEMES